eukprot:TRINITY_DN7404_c0_g1_i1.p1 TRINITY_DN7404_c0_g1~~TRINITY_DN7404_c0_g1_i1.p1  ORF type:complete len:1162 (-),score=261.07 TRINITY_DN7404_c0_g1_i1:87-3572(-)
MGSTGNEMRIVNILGGGQEFCSNKVVTTHYTKWNFVPKNLYEQFSKPANMWFLLLAVLQMTPRVTTTNGVPSIALPLVTIICANALKDAVEDYRRFKSDKEENERHTLAQAARSETLASDKWENVRVGSLVVVKANQYIPTDLVILSTAHPLGHCFIETANLDGETNLKTKQAPKALFAMVDEQNDPEAAVAKVKKDMEGHIECEGPNEFLYQFVGTMHTKKPGGEQEKVPLDADSVVLRGCKLKNVPWIVGLAVYTGRETKIMQNSKDRKSRKMSHLDQDVGRLTLIIFLLQNILCIIAAIYSATFSTSEDNLDLRYLGLTPTGQAEEYESWILILVIRFGNFLILFSNFIPISLLVSMSFVKLLQAGFFYFDKEMIYETEVFNEKVEIHCIPRTSDLNEELGQVEYVFSDKTGTLTRNVMDFRKFFVRGQCYGEGMTEIRRCVLAKMGQVPPPPSPPQPGARRTPHVDLVDHTLEALMESKQGEQYEAVRNFLLHLAINHEVVADPQEGTYSAASPDESALCYGARHFGFAYRSRDNEGIKVDMPDGSLLDVEVLVVIKFNSTRKRSSVVVRYNDRGEQRLWLYTKGADSIIMERLKKAEQGTPETKAANTTLSEMSLDGLRTLCLAGKPLTQAEYDAWNKIYQEAATATEGRQDKMDAAAEELEKDLELHGCTGIEDRLQDAVGETCEKMFKAGIKVWMLTGDKVETAINISIATGLLEPDTESERTSSRILLTTEDAEENGVFDPKAISSQLTRIAEKTRTEAGPSQTEQKGGPCARLIHWAMNVGGPRVQHRILYEGMVIDGKCLEIALQPENQENFVTISRHCRTVVCCRVSPKQKGEVVRLIKSHEKAITLAIGDGANDCNMIQSADVGVGIRGLEGLQAFNVCDYGIAQFRFLQQLLFVHGRWCYRRIAILANYTFYKNIVVVLPQYFLGFVSGCSGQKLYNDLMYQTFNVIHTMLPIVLFGLFDQDVSRRTSLNHPELYDLGLRRSYLNPKASAGWLLSGLWHSIVVFFVPYLVMSNGNVTHSDGKANDIWLVGSVIYLLVTLVANIVVLLETCWLSWITPFGIGLSLFGWFSMHAYFAGDITGSVVFSELYGTTGRIFGCPMIYLVIVTSVVMAVMVDIQAKGIKCAFFPNVLHRVQALVLEEKRGLKAKL